MNHNVNQDEWSRFNNLNSWPDQSARQMNECSPGTSFVSCGRVDPFRQPALPPLQNESRYFQGRSFTRTVCLASVGAIATAAYSLTYCGWGCVCHVNPALAMGIGASVGVAVSLLTRTDALAEGLAKSAAKVVAISVATAAFAGFPILTGICTRACRFA